MLSNFTGGGQIFLHKLRMFMQVLQRSLISAFLLSIIISSCIAARKANKLDFKAAIIHQKAIFAEMLEQTLSRVKIEFKADNYSIRIKNHHSQTANKSLVTLDRADQVTKLEAAYRQVVDFIKIYMLMILSMTAGIFGLIYIAWSKLGKDAGCERQKLGSSKILSTQEVAKLLKKFKQASKFYIGSLPLVKDSETKHFLVTGATGSGKTNLIDNLLPQVANICQNAVIIDQTGEMIAKYYDPNRGDIIFNPFDQRTSSWNFWADCASSIELERFARILFSFNRKKNGHNADPFWEQSAEIVFLACVDYQKSHGGLSVEQLCALINNSSVKSLQDKLKGSAAARYLEADSKSIASSILSVLTTNTKPLSYLSDLTAQKSFCLKAYFQNLNQGSWLFLATQPSARDLTLPLIACLVELAFSQLINLGINSRRRVWFVIDELAALGKLPALSILMADGRKYGACLLCGLQSLNQLYGSYGQYDGSTIFGQFGTNFFFRNNEPVIAKMVSNMCGVQTMLRQQKNTSFGADEFRGGVSYSEQKERQSLIEYSDLASLRAGECFVLLPEPRVRIAKLQTPKARLVNKNCGFIAACGLSATEASALTASNLTDDDYYQ